MASEKRTTQVSEMLKDIKESHSQQVESLKESHAKMVEMLKETHAKLVTNLEDLHAKEVKRLNKQHVQEMTSLATEANQIISKKNEVIERLLSRLEDDSKKQLKLTPMDAEAEYDEKECMWKFTIKLRRNGNENESDNVNVIKAVSNATEPEHITKALLSLKSSNTLKNNYKLLPNESLSCSDVAQTQLQSQAGAATNETKQSTEMQAQQHNATLLNMKPSINSMQSNVQNLHVNLIDTIDTIVPMESMGASGQDEVNYESKKFTLLELFEVLNEKPGITVFDAYKRVFLVAWVWTVLVIVHSIYFAWNSSELKIYSNRVMTWVLYIGCFLISKWHDSVVTTYGYHWAVSLIPSLVLSSCFSCLCCCFTSCFNACFNCCFSSCSSSSKCRLRRWIIWWFVCCICPYALSGAAAIGFFALLN